MSASENNRTNVVTLVKKLVQLEDWWWTPGMLLERGPDRYRIVGHDPQRGWLLVSPSAQVWVEHIDPAYLPLVYDPATQAILEAELVKRLRYVGDDRILVRALIGAFGGTL